MKEVKYLNLDISNFEVVKNKEEFIDNIEIKKSSKLPKNFPYLSMIILIVIVSGCLFSDLVMTHDPKFMDLANSNVSPNNIFYFGTDTMGRDIFSDIWYGGKISLFIGVFSTIISTTIAIIYGSISGMAPEWIDDVMMKATEIFLSIPSILVIIFVQAIIGGSNPISISLVIGVVSWMNIAKIIRSEVRQIRNSEYILAAQIMGGNFFYIVKQHLIPNFVSSIMFMVVSNIGSAIGTEATLSFLGIGLPIEVISWGSMLSLAQDALLSNYWWIIVIPGVFLVITLVCIANIGNYMRRKNIKKYNNL
ncbi:ABC transporter permease [Clostridium saudiense]|jgi:peptide/nickel transport system permease protein|uniref:ABC transporter permease n=1 Tax=Clostridium saudiense TaxID=1414720 RepID=A0ABS2FLA2_9CLOT|nr:ABC transporter permease [Clostridium saudiense]